MAHSPLPKRARWGDQLDNIRRVLVVNTGGTIGMVDKGRGYEPERGFMEGFLRKLSMFHDTDAYDPELHGPGLLTGISTFKKRIYYEIIEYDPVVDSSDMNMTDWVKIATTIEENYDKFNGIYFTLCTEFQNSEHLYRLLLWAVVVLIHVRCMLGWVSIF
eukprot:m.566226 g.566226  ORF g.566226 m.566226 type:complete len:160 (+) comp22248_c0_seq12:177-656(+)